MKIDFNAGRILFASLCLILPIAAMAQGPSFVPTAIQDTVPPDVYTSLKARLTEQNQTITEPKAKIKAFIKTIQTERFDYIVKTFNDDRLIQQSELNDRLNTIFKNILVSNPQIPQDASLYVYRSESPNALSFGEGTIVISLALLSRLENDAQIAFVLSHELAHYYGDHTDKAIEEYARVNFDKELNKEIKTIRNSQYERYTRMKEVMKGLELSFNKHSRTHEFEADSVGLTLFLNSKYADRYAPVRTMEVLDSVDQPVFKNLLDFKKFFDFKEYPFKDSWIAYKKSAIWHYQKEVSDTAQTHPSCWLRGLALQRQLQHAEIDKKNEPVDFVAVRLQAQIDLIESNYHFKQYGRALFEAMALSETYPQSAYLHGMIGKCLYKLYISQKNHELGKVIELPDPRFPENYDRFLTFIHALRLSDLEKLAYYYVTNCNDSYFSNEDFLHAVWLCSKLPVSKLSTASVEEDYKEMFPNGKYRKEIK